MSDLKDFIAQIEKKKKELSTLFRDKMPVLVGRMAKDHYQENFRQGGFVNGGLHPWPQSQRLSSGGSSAGSQYGTLLSGRNHLFSSISYTPSQGRVRVYNPVVYASAHNFGETITIPVTNKMRKMGWAKYYAAGGGAGSGESNEQAEFWKRFALMPKTKKTITLKMPERPFIGESEELNQKISQKQEAEIRKIIET